MSRLWNSFKISFSMYSKIPMPYSDWSGENMKYVMGFFPLIGVVIGIVAGAWAWIAETIGLALDNLFRVAVCTAIPLLITGGIHMDGFLDTSDALSSWQEKERRLEILKDSHAGAFAIISCAVYMILYMGAVSVIEGKTFLLIGFYYMIIRGASGLSIVRFPKAKNTGLAAMFSDNAHKNVIQIWMLVYLVIGVVCTLAVNPVPAVVCNLLVLGIFLYYRWMSEKNFGGINGDLAGWFLQMAELLVMLGAAVTTLAMGGSLWN